AASPCRNTQSAVQGWSPSPSDQRHTVRCRSKGDQQRRRSKATRENASSPSPAPLLSLALRLRISRHLFEPCTSLSHDTYDRCTENRTGRTATSCPCRQTCFPPPSSL